MRAKQFLVTVCVASATVTATATGCAHTPDSPEHRPSGTHSPTAPSSPSSSPSVSEAQLRAWIMQRMAAESAWEKMTDRQKEGACAEYREGKAMMSFYKGFLKGKC